MAGRNEAETMARGSRWPLDRLLFVLAGTVTLVGVGLGWLISPWFLLVPTFVGINQWIYAWKGECPASLVLKRLGARGGWPEVRGPAASSRTAADRG